MDRQRQKACIRQMELLFLFKLLQNRPDLFGFFVSSRVEKISFSGIRPQSTSASSFSGILLRSRADTTLR